MREQLLQDGTLDAGPTDDLLIDLPAAGLPECIPLEGKALVLHADSDVSDLHASASRVQKTRCVFSE